MGAGSLKLPTGTVTFLFTDIEGSTELLQAVPDDYERLLLGHRAILEEAIDRFGGCIVDLTGDSCFAAFDRAANAIRAAVAAQRVFLTERLAGGALRVRMGLHTGEPTISAAGYIGIDVHRAARIASAAHGGQILCSRPTYELVASSLPDGVVAKDLGDHRLKDLRGALRLYQVGVDSVHASFPPVRTLEGYQHNLPFQVNEIIGREHESEAIRKLLRSKRLVTLIGPGGIGKTRLALDVAAGEPERYAHGVWYVELSSLTDPDLLSQTVAVVLGVRAQSDAPIQALLVEYLRHRQLLLLLDNCEHLLQACASLSNTLLAACGELRLLVTSREALGISGEWVRMVPSLGVPAHGSVDIDEVGRSESVRLFVERARAVNGSFELGPADGSALAEICRRLDGIPLAIELAASRTKVLSLTEIARRLDDRFRLLTGGSRTALPRQQTLRALIDWSYELLLEKERTVFRRLSVFCCGWTLEAAEEVCAGGDIDPQEVLDLVAMLIDKSLASVEGARPTTRYRLLETIRHYARERLSSTSESQSVRDRHLDYFLSIAEEADSMLRGPDQERWLTRIDQQEDEFRAALDWALTNGAVEKLQRLAAALWRYWRMRSLFAEGRQWLERAAALLENKAGLAPREELLLVARCLIGAGSLANYQGDYERAVQLLTRAVELCRAIDDSGGLANSLNLLAHARMMTGNLEGAAEMLQESRAIFLSLEDKRGMAYGKYFLGSLLGAQGRYEAARDSLEEGLTLLEELEDTWWIENALLELGWVNSRIGERERALAVLKRALSIGRKLADRRGTARAMMHLAEVELAEGAVEEATRSYHESLVGFFEIGDKWGVVSCIEGIAAMTSEGEDCKRAVHLLGASARIRESLKARVLAFEQRDHENLLSALKASLGEKEFVQAFTEGRALSLKDAVEQALALQR